MLKTVLCVMLLSAALLGQEKQPGIAGTWVLDLAGHQVGLGLELDGKKLTGTLVVMGQNVLVEGEFADAYFSLASAPDEARKFKLSGKLKDDGTIEGDIETDHGTHHWKGEKLQKQSPFHSLQSTVHSPQSSVANCPLKSA
jgi:hypothetical protein